MLNPHAVLIIQLAHLGDAILTTPLISALGKSFPGSKIDVLTRSQNLTIFKGNEFVNTIYQYDSSKYLRSGGELVASCHFEQLSKINYDVVIYVKGDIRTLFYLVFGRYRKAVFCKAIGYSLRLTWLRVAGIRLPETKCFHYVESMFVALRKIGIDLSDYASESSLIAITEEAREKAAAVIRSIAENKQYIVLHCSTPFPYRNWPKERFAELIGYVVEKWGFRCLLVGDDASRAVCEEIREDAGSELVANVAGKLGLMETLAVISNAVAYVGNDSGPLHMAGATDTPCLAFYGPQLPELFGPWQTKGRVLYKRRSCSPCWQSGCLSPSRYCMTDITACEAKEAFDAIMKEVGKSPVRV